MSDSGIYLEFVKALKTIEKTQLVLRPDLALQSKEEAIRKYHELEKNAESNTDAASVDFEHVMNEKRIVIMRKILSSNLKTYSDKYANYIAPDALKKYDARRNGKFLGVGLKFREVKDGYPIVIGAILGGPLDGMDIQPDDRIISVDGHSVAKFSAAKILQLLKGSENSTATIEILRNKAHHSVAVTRAAVDIHYADAEMMNNNVGYVKVSRFGSETHIQFGKLLTQLIEKGAHGIVLDLRDNPGGSTRAARAIVSMFCTEQDIYCEKNKLDEFKQLPRHGEHITGLPLAVLINSASMSCSEIVAGALQTYGRGTIVGTTSFGKGLIQRVFRLEQPLGGAVRTTIAVFGTPDRKLIHGVGVVPDIQVKTDSDFMFRRTGSLNISNEARLFQRTLNERFVKKNHPARAVEYMAAQDVQLQRAIDVILPTS